MEWGSLWNEYQEKHNGSCLCQGRTNSLLLQNLKWVIFGLRHTLSIPSLSVTKTDGQPQTNLFIFYGALILQHLPTVYALRACVLKARTPLNRDYSASGGFILNNTIKWRWWWAVILPTLSQFTVKHVSVRDVLSCWECFNQPLFFLLLLFPRDRELHGNTLLNKVYSYNLH